MILKMTDNTQLYITQEQADRIEYSITQGNEVVILPNSTMLKTKNILSILPGSDPTKIDAARILEEGRRTATDEGVRAAREKLEAKLRIVRAKKQLENVQNLLSRPIARNVPKRYDEPRG